MMLDHSAQSGTHSLLERGPDFYATPPQAVRALLRVEKLLPEAVELRGFSVLPGMSFTRQT
jgi:hypothetical protein